MFITRLRHWVFHKKIDLMWRGGGALLLFSFVLLIVHIMEVRNVRNVGLPLAAIIPDLEKRLRVLEEQVEVARIHSATQRGAPEEFVHMYVLPEHSSMDRVIATLELLHNVLKKNGQLVSMTPIDIGTQHTEENIVRWPVSFTVNVTEEGLRSIALFLRIAGLFTVADTLTEQDVRQLMLYAESENPVGIIALEQFLSADLLSYTQDYELLMAMVRKSFISPAFDRLFTGLQEDSLLREVRLLLGGALGEELRKNNLWPLRFMTVDAVTITTKDNGTKEAAFALSVYSRR